MWCCYVVYVPGMFLRRENIECEQAILINSQRPGDNAPWRSQLYFIPMITMNLFSTVEIRYLQQRIFTKQNNLHALSFYIHPGLMCGYDNERQEKHDAA
ncbi:Uncharacterised protein [Salmonella enterica subsp. arizonae]|uniref:Uncharacterized protein n=1 Tax=Salmonella enterica subsp. arizonae TaxID=59203 RepID=A0A379SVS4_SALER|nr:Uncharacterised protein [Salmonella enterica subsp. arizonae]